MNKNLYIICNNFLDFFGIGSTTRMQEIISLIVLPRKVFEAQWTRTCGRFPKKFFFYYHFLSPGHIVDHLILSTEDTGVPG